jgi:bacterioferritin (cytochrome b1)
MSTIGSDDRTWVARVFDHLSAHVQAEDRILDEYTEAIANVDAPDVRYLMELIAEDEVRHHRVFEEMVHAIQGSMRWEHIEPKVPERGTRPVPEAIRTLIDRFLAAEREDRKHLKELRRQLAPVATTTLWPLLVQLMELDTEKHILILESLAARSAR